jgi:hypothetical protein
MYALGVVFLELLAPFQTNFERSKVIFKLDLVEIRVFFQIREQIRKHTDDNSDIKPILASYDKEVDFNLSVSGLVLE